MSEKGDNFVKHNYEICICFLCKGCFNAEDEENEMHSMSEEKLQFLTSNDKMVLKYSLSEVLSYAIETDISKQNTISNYLCNSCAQIVEQFVSIKYRYDELKNLILEKYNEAENNLEIFEVVNNEETFTNMDKGESVILKIERENENFEEEFIHDNSDDDYCNDPHDNNLEYEAITEAEKENNDELISYTEQNRLNDFENNFDKEDHSNGSELESKIEVVQYTQPYILKDSEVICSLCPNSESVTFDLHTIEIHLRTMHMIRINICEICGEACLKKSELRRHMNKFHDGDAGELKCQICDKVFEDIKELKQHKRSHKSTKFICTQCDKQFNSKNLLEQHKNMHTGVRPYKCSYCPKDFASKYTLATHMKIHQDRPRQFPCSQCSKSFYSAQNLQQHEKIHTGIKDYVCNVCNKSFGTQHNLVTHSIVHSGYKPFICRTCGKAFARKAEIKDHERIHTGEKPFKCDICNSSFAQRSNLTSHIRVTHMNDRRYKCDMCDRNFKRRRLLDYHIRAVHTGERPYKCNVCDASFVYPEHCKKHKRIHTGEKPYACELCGKRFNSRDNRNFHRFVHSDKKPYECLICGQGFMRKAILMVHMQQSGHVNDTIVVNHPRISESSDTKTDQNIYLDENITLNGFNKELVTTNENPQPLCRNDSDLTAVPIQLFETSEETDNDTVDNLQNFIGNNIDELEKNNLQFGKESLSWIN